MNQWPYEVKSHSMAAIQQAVNDADWQNFRLTLKGRSTPEKLDMLFAHIQFNNVGHATSIRVDNYINALKRGGQLDEHCRVQR